MSEPERIVNDDNIIQFAEKKIFLDLEKMTAGITEESKSLREKFQKKITSMYMVTLLLYGKPIEVTSIEYLGDDLHDHFIEVRDNLPELPKILKYAMNITEYLRWKGFSEVSKDEFIKTFNDLIKLFKKEASDYIDANFENIPVTVFIESNSEWASDDIVEEYAEENDINEDDIDDAQKEEMMKKEYKEAKIEMIKDFISTLI